MKKALLLAASLVMLSYADDNWNAGQAIGSSTLNHFKGNMSGNINNPITTDQQLATVDGSKTGDGKIICGEGSTKEYLSIGYSGTSDITVSVQMDKNLDGSKETSWSFAGISGVCSNGAIKCSSGTWNNCKYYEWGYSGGTLWLNETQPDLVGGCYCINSSCGSLAGTQKASVLNDVSGAIAPLMSDSSQYVITKAENDGNTVKYWGQDYSNCSNSSGTKPSISMDGSNMQSQSDNAALSQSNDDTSAYYILNEGAGNNTPLDDSYKTDLTNRSTSVKASATNTTGTNNYAYTDSLSGSSINVSGSLLLGAQGEAKYCEVEWTKENTDAFLDETNRENGTTNNQVKYTEMRECINDWTVCPVNAGESVKHQCGAIDNFAEITGALNAVSEATKDMVCSSTN